jgi:hypothetical protein
VFAGSLQADRFSSFNFGMPNRDSILEIKKPKVRLTFGNLVVGLCTILSVCVVAWYLNGMLNLGYEDYARATLGIIVRDEKKFAEAHPTVGYTCDSSKLATDRARAMGLKNGYVFEIGGCRAVAGAGPNTSY